MDLIELAQAVVNQVSEVVLLTDRDGIVWFAGPRVTQKLAFAVDEATGRPLWNVMRPDGPATSEIEDLFRRAMRGEVPGGRGLPHWIVLRANDGRPVPGWLTLIPIGRPPAEDAMVVFRPVESAADEHHLWRAIIDAIDDPVIALDRQMRVRELNTAAKALAGNVSGELKGQPCMTVFNHGDHAPANCPLTESFRGRRTVCRVITDRAGRQFEATCWPILDSEGRALLVLERLRAVDDGHGAQLTVRERLLLETLETLHDQISRVLVRVRPVSGGLEQAEVRQVGAALERSRALAVSTFQRVATESDGG